MAEVCSKNLKEAIVKGGGGASWDEEDTRSDTGESFACGGGSCRTL